MTERFDNADGSISDLASEPVYCIPSLMKGKGTIECNHKCPYFVSAGIAEMNQELYVLGHGDLEKGWEIILQTDPERERVLRYRASKMPDCSVNYPMDNVNSKPRIFKK